VVAAPPLILRFPFAGSSLGGPRTHARARARGQGLSVRAEGSRVNERAHTRKRRDRRRRCPDPGCRSLPTRRLTVHLPLSAPPERGSFKDESERTRREENETRHGRNSENLPSSLSLLLSRKNLIPFCMLEYKRHGEKNAPHRPAPNAGRLEIETFDCGLFEISSSTTFV